MTWKCAVAIGLALAAAPTAGKMTVLRSEAAEARTAGCASAQSSRGDRAPLSPAAADAQRKLEAIAANGESASPRPLTTELTEGEINAYINSSAIRLPEGVHNVHLTGLQGEIIGAATVNFDEVKSGRSSMNPLLSLFSGTHSIRVQARGSGARGTASVDVESVQIDDTEVPRVAIELFIDHYLKPKYPGIGMHSTFPLSDHIDSAIVGPHVLTLMQR